MTPQETDSDMTVSVQESGGGVGRRWPAAGLGALSVSMPAWDLLKKVTIIFIQFSSIQFSHSVVSDSLRPHELQHARPPCSSPSPAVHSDSRPMRQ